MNARAIKICLKTINKLIEYGHRLPGSIVEQVQLIYEFLDCELQALANQTIIKLKKQNYKKKNNNQIIEELISLNENIDKVSVVTSYNKIQNYISTNRIKYWSDKQFKEWGEITYKNKANKDFTEILSVLISLYELIFKFNLNDNQILALILLVNEKDSGCILQMLTGEGKSTVIAIFAAFKALCGIKIYVITSSSVLVKRDAGKFKIFYETLGLTANHNIRETLDISAQGTFSCYKANILYGSISDFRPQSNLRSVKSLN